MQSTTDRTDLVQDPRSIGDLETRYIAESIPATVTIDGAEYTIDADTDSETITDIVDQHEEFSSVAVEFACKYCDEKLSVQYSGEIPSHVSCECSHCAETVTITSNLITGNTVSLQEFFRFVRIYQNRRASYLKGLQNPDASVSVITSVCAYGFAMCSMMSLGILIVAGIIQVTNPLTIVATIVASAVLTVLGIFMYSVFPKLYFRFDATESSLVLEDFYEGVREASD